MPQNNRVTKIKWMPLPRTEKAEALKNPYCGLYVIFRFYAGSDRRYPTGEVIESILPDPDQQLCLMEINLLPYREEPLPEGALHIIRRVIRHFASQGKQLILRFMYDWEGKGVLNEPKDIGIILGHMGQLSPLLKEYTEAIYILQGLFIGSWGEMHSSRYLGERSMVRLAKQIYGCAGEKTQIALRCPSFWRMIFKTYHPLDGAEAFTGIQKARFGLFNDGIMASEADFGTYGSISAMDAKAYGDKWLREEELEFQNKLCRYVSNGGEVIHECPYNDAEQAIETLRRMRVSYLHAEYDEGVLSKWKAARLGSPYAPWKDRTAFEYIEAHLGYRFTLGEASLSPAPGKGSLRAAVKITNKGFAPCYHKFEIKFIVRTASFSEVHEYGVDTDTRRWMPEERVELETEIPVSGWGQKSYILGFSIYDPRSGQPIRIANTFSAADHMGVYSLGNFMLGT
ncbi:MAG TPA: DUF4832 domain-containing protein [Clostridiales bacterium]|nr:DUF4832 domain-containing protein [Clostridiales bacterium]